MTGLIRSGKADQSPRCVHLPDAFPLRLATAEQPEKMPGTELLVGRISHGIPSTAVGRILVNSQAISLEIQGGAALVSRGLEGFTGIPAEPSGQGKARVSSGKPPPWYPQRTPPLEMMSVSMGHVGCPFSSHKCSPEIPQGGPPTESQGKSRAEQATRVRERLAWLRLQGYSPIHAIKEPLR